MLSFIDNYKGINIVYFLKQKSDTLEATQKFLSDTAPLGKVKHLPRSLFDMACCLLLGANFPKQLWPFAVLAFACIRNPCFNYRLGTPPFEVLTGKRPQHACFSFYTFSLCAKREEIRRAKQKVSFCGLWQGEPCIPSLLPCTKEGQKGMTHKIS